MTRDHRTARLTLGAGILWACLFAVSTGRMAAAPPAPGNDKPVSPSPAGEGLTRESLSDPGRPDPAQTRLPPLPPPPAVPDGPTPARTVAPASTVPATAGRSAGSHRRRTVVAHHHRRSRLRQHAPPVARVVVHPRPRRNPVVKLVYWWNGFLIRRLHTKIGTVFLGTVGADT